MNPGDDKTLREALDHWKVAAPLPPRFRENVWRRIAQAETARPQPWSWLINIFDRRAFSLSYVAALLVFGLFAGYWQGRAQERHFDAQLAQRYVRTVAPYQDLQ